jgi:hypothetical protein
MRGCARRFKHLVLVGSLALRNLIAHDNEDEDLAAPYREEIALAPVMLLAARAAAAWGAAVG